MISQDRRELFLVVFTKNSKGQWGAKNMSKRLMNKTSKQDDKKAAEEESTAVFVDKRSTHAQIAVQTLSQAHQGVLFCS